MRSISIGAEPIAAVSLCPAPQTVPDGGFAQSLQETVDIGSSIPSAPAEKPVQSVNPQQNAQEVTPQESTFTPQPEQQAQETVQPQQYEESVHITGITEEQQTQKPVEKPAEALPFAGVSQPDEELMKELADLLGATQKQLTAPQRMQETVKGLISQAFKDLNDPEKQEEEFTEKVLEFLLTYIDRKFGGETEETSIFADKDEKLDEDVQDVLLQTVVQMLDNIRSEDEDNNVPEEAEDEVEAIPSDNMAAEYAKTTANELLGLFDEVEKTAETDAVTEVTVIPAATEQKEVPVPQQKAPEHIGAEAVTPERATNAVENPERATNVAESPKLVPNVTESTELVVEAVESPERITDAAATVQQTQTGMVIPLATDAEEVNPQPIEIGTVSAEQVSTDTVSTQQTEAETVNVEQASTQTVSTTRRVKFVEGTPKEQKAAEIPQKVQTEEKVQSIEKETVSTAESNLYQAAEQTAKNIYTAIVRPSLPEEPIHPEKIQKLQIKEDTFRQPILHPIIQPVVQPFKVEKPREIGTMSVIQPADELQELTRLVKGVENVTPEQPQLDLDLSGKQETLQAAPTVKLKETDELVPFEAVIANSVPQVTLTRSFADTGSGAQQVVAQIASEIFNNIPESGGTTTFVMTLNPETLGKVTVKLVEEAGKISVTVTAQSKRTAEILAERFDNLNTAMKENGTQLEKYQVVYAPEKDEGSGQQNFDGSSKNPYVRQDDEESEGSGEFAELLQQAV